MLKYTSKHKQKLIFRRRKGKKKKKRESFPKRLTAVRCLIDFPVCLPGPADLQEQLDRAMRLEEERRRVEQEAARLEAERMEAIIAKEELARQAEEQMKSQEQLVSVQRISEPIPMDVGTHVKVLQLLLKSNLRIQGEAPHQQKCCIILLLLVCVCFSFLLNCLTKVAALCSRFRLRSWPSTRPRSLSWRRPREPRRRKPIHGT